MAASLKLRVPAVYLTSANVLFISFLAFNEINKLRVISRGQNSDSPRLQYSNCCVINGLRRIPGVHVPLVSNASGSALLFETVAPASPGVSKRWERPSDPTPAFQAIPVAHLSDNPCQLNRSMQHHLIC